MNTLFVKYIGYFFFSLLAIHRKDGEAINIAHLLLFMYLGQVRDASEEGILQQMHARVYYYHCATFKYKMANS